MTDNEIKKALECCAELKCHECPYEPKEWKQGSFGCMCEIQGVALDLINRQKEEKEHLEYVLMAVMHSVDKWLEGDELKQDEANRACTMREKTLKITEKLHKKIDGLQKAKQESFVAIEKRKAEIERLQTEKAKLHKLIPKMIKEAKSEAYKEFAERLKGKALVPYGCLSVVCGCDIDNLLKEMAGE